jgi:hypothetical protein
MSSLYASDKIGTLFAKAGIRDPLYRAFQKELYKFETV